MGSFNCHSVTMSTSWIDAGMELLEKVNWDEVKETAKFYYSDSTTTLNLYPALGITFLILILLVPLLGSLPSIDLFGVSSGYNGYGQTGPSSGYGAPEASYAAPSSSYGPARNSWSQGGEYRSFQTEEGENLQDIYGSTDDWTENSNVARSIDIAGSPSPINNLINNAMKLVN